LRGESRYLLIRLSDWINRRFGLRNGLGGGSGGRLGLGFAIDLGNGLG
jgi:hypothetical protein